MATKSEIFKSIENINLDVDFQDIFGKEHIERLQTLFADAFGVSCYVTDASGKAITKTYNYCTLCKDIIIPTKQGIADCVEMHQVLSAHHANGPFIKECRNTGLWEAGINIVAGDKHIGSWIIGQIQNDYKYDNQIKTITDKLGVNQEEYTLALYDIPLMPAEKFKNIANMITVYLNDIADKAYKNLQLKHYIANKEGLVD